MLKCCLIRLKELHKFCKKNKKASFDKKDLTDNAIIAIILVASPKYLLWTQMNADCRGRQRRKSGTHKLKKSLNLWERVQTHD